MILPLWNSFPPLTAFLSSDHNVAASRGCVLLFSHSFGSVEDRRAFTWIPVKQHSGKSLWGAELLNKPFMLLFVNLGLSGFFFNNSTSSLHSAKLCLQEHYSGTETMLMVSWSSVLQTPNRFNKTHLMCSY